MQPFQCLSLSRAHLLSVPGVETKHASVFMLHVSQTNSKRSLEYSDCTVRTFCWLKCPLFSHNVIWALIAQFTSGVLLNFLFIVYSQFSTLTCCSFLFKCFLYRHMSVEQHLPAASCISAPDFLCAGWV